MLEGQTAKERMTMIFFPHILLLRTEEGLRHGETPEGALATPQGQTSGECHIGSRFADVSPNAPNEQNGTVPRVCIMPWRKDSLMYVIVCKDGALEERDYYVSNLRLDLSQAAADSILKQYSFSLARVCRTSDMTEQTSTPGYCISPIS